MCLKWSMKRRWINDLNQPIYKTVIMRFRLALLTVVLLMTPLAVSAQHVLTLDEAISRGLKNNHGILIAAERLNILENNLTPGNAGMLPSVTLDASRQYTLTNVNQVYQDGRTLETDGIKANTYSLGPRLDWTLFDGMGMFINRDKLQNLKEIGDNRYRAQVEWTVAEITTTYADLTRQQQILNVLLESIDISKQRLKIAEDKFDVGSGARVQVLQAQVALNEDESAWRNQQVLVQNTMVALNVLMGHQPEATYTVSDRIEIDGALDFSELTIGVLEANPDLLIARQNELNARLDARLIQSERLPVLSANAGYSFTGSENSAGFFVEQNNRGLSYGLTARVPLFDGFNLNRRVQNARIDTKIAEIEREQLELDLIAALTSVYTQYANALELIELEEQNLLVAQENAAIALDRFQLGTYTPVELREAQQALLNTESRLVIARYNAKATETQLLLMSGKIGR